MRSATLFGQPLPTAHRPKRLVGFVLFLISALQVAASPALGASLTPDVQLLVQVRDPQGKFVTQPGQPEPTPVYRPLPATDPRYAAAQEALTRHPTVVLERVLIAAAKRLAMSTARGPWKLDAWQQAAHDPIYISVEGAWAERGWFGLALQREDGAIEQHPHAPIVELAYTLEDIQNGDWAKGLSHELGHALLLAAAGPTVEPWLRAYPWALRPQSGAHDAQRTTENLQALNEGLAEHFEALAFLGESSGEAMAKWLKPGGGVMNARRFGSPRTLRVQNIIWGRYAFEPLLPRLPEAQWGAKDTWVAYRAAQALDNHRLRSCNTQLENEGLVATLLTRAAHHPQLRTTALASADLARLAPQGLDANAQREWLASIGPTAAFHLQLVLALHELPVASESIAGDLGVREVVEAWLSRQPQDLAGLVEVVVNTTLGATVSLELAQKLRRELAQGVVSVPVSDPSREHFTAMQRELDAVVQGLIATKGKDLFAACGRPLWVDVSGRELPMDFGDDHAPLQLDLNAAELMDLLQIPSVDANQARALLAARDRQVGFLSLDAVLSATRLGVKAKASLHLHPLTPPR